MKKLVQLKNLYLFILVFVVTTSSAQNILEATYYFVNNKKLFSLEQRNDTIYEYRCYENFECSQKPRRSYKIVKYTKEADSLLLLLERVDTIPLSTEPIKNDRFYIMGIQKLSNNKIKVVNEIKSYTKDAISKLSFDFDLVKDKFGFTYYEESYLKSLHSDFKIDKSMANEIITSIKFSYQEVIERYKNTKTGDVYSTGILSELIGREMVNRNLSPISARSKLEEAEK